MRGRPSSPRLLRRTGFARPFLSFPQPNVTSNLDPEIQRADHRQGGGGTQPILQKARKCFQLKILTSNSYRLKILQTIFADPAPVKAFRGVGEGGIPQFSPTFPKRERSNALSARLFSTIFSGGFPQEAYRLPSRVLPSRARAGWFGSHKPCKARLPRFPRRTRSAQE